MKKYGSRVWNMDEHSVIILFSRGRCCYLPISHMIHDAVVMCFIMCMCGRMIKCTSQPRLLFYAVHAVHFIKRKVEHRQNNFHNLHCCCTEFNFAPFSFRKNEMQAIKLPLKNVSLRAKEISCTCT